MFLNKQPRKCLFCRISDVSARNWLLFSPFDRSSTEWVDAGGAVGSLFYLAPAQADFPRACFMQHDQAQDSQVLKRAELGSPQTKQKKKKNRNNKAKKF